MSAQDGERPWVSEDDAELEELVRSMKIDIKVIGCGGGGCNTVNRIVEKGLPDVETIACNTDAPHLRQVKAGKKILLGRYATRGLGAGSDPNMGEHAAREAIEDLEKALQKVDIAFITAGMGGGTGTGAAPYVAEMARQKGRLVIGIVTLPFAAEGQQRMTNADFGLKKLEKVCHTTIVIPNDRLIELVPNLPLNEAFKLADEILLTAINSISEMILKPGMVNLDFNDLLTVMEGGGVAMLSIGESDSSRDRVKEAVDEAMSSPLLYLDVNKANRALIYVVGGEDMSLKEAEEVAEMVGGSINKNSRIIWGCSVDPTMENSIRVTLILAGISDDRDIGVQEIESGDLGLDII